MSRRPEEKLQQAYKMAAPVDAYAQAQPVDPHDALTAPLSAPIPKLTGMSAAAPVPANGRMSANRGGALGSINGPWVDDEPEGALGRVQRPRMSNQRTSGAWAGEDSAPPAIPSLNMSGLKPLALPSPTLPKVTTPFLQAQETGRNAIQHDQDRLQYLKRSGSGIDQITHPVDESGNPTGAHVGFGKKLLGTLARVGDVAYGALLPNVAALTPGTTLHHQLLQGQEEGRLSDDLEHQFRMGQTANAEAMPEYRQSQIELGQERQRSTAQHQRDQEENTLRNHGYKRGGSGQIEPLTYEEMSPQQQAVFDLKGSQDELAQANKDFKDAQRKNLPDQMELARRRAATAERNAQTASERLGLSREALTFHEDEFYNQQPTGQERRVGDLARSALDQIRRMRDIAQSRRDQFGPTSGSKTQFETWLGSEDPDAAAYRAAQTFLSEHGAGVLGARSIHVINDIKNLVNSRQNPEALESTFNQAQSTFEHFVKAGTTHGRPDALSGNQQSGGKGSVSLKDAMSLPENKGKSEDDVKRDIRSHGYEVR